MRATLPACALRLAWRIGSANGLVALPPRPSPQHPSPAATSGPRLVRRRATLAGAGHASQDGLGTGGFGKLGGSKSHYNNLPGIETQGV